MRFYVKGQTLTRSGREIVATEAVNYPNVEIEFDSSWDGVAGRTAVFQSVNTVYNAVTPSAIDGTAYGMLLTEGEDGIWRTHVPYEILDEDAPNKFIVTVFGGSVNNKRITTNPITVEITSSFYDPGTSPGTPTPALWDQVVDLLEDIEDDMDLVPGLVEDVGELQNDVSDLETEIADARIDTNDTTWPTLGQAIRGQVTGFKNYMQYSGFLAEITTQEGKKWQAGQNNTVELVDASDNTTSAISAKILYQPTGCYIRMRNNNHSGQFTEWWGLNSEEVVIQNDTNLVRNQFIFNKLVRGIVEIRFNSDTEKIAAAQVICSNETYGYQYDEVVSDTKSIKWMLDHGATEVLLGTAEAQRWQTEFTISPSLNYGDLIHVTGDTYGDLPMSMKIYQSGTSNEQKFYDSQSSEYTIDIYVYVNGLGYDTFRVWSKYGNSYSLRVYKVEFANHVYSTEEKDSGRRWTDGSKIYERTYHVTKVEELSQADTSVNQNKLIDVVIGTLNYKHTLVDYEIRQDVWNGQRRNQQVVTKDSNADTNNFIRLAPSLYIYDTNTSGAYNAEIRANLLCRYESYSGAYYKYAKADITVYYMKTKYTIPYSASMVQPYASSAFYDVQDYATGVNLVLKNSGAIALFSGHTPAMHKVKVLMSPLMHDMIRSYNISAFTIRPILFILNEGDWSPVLYPSAEFDARIADPIDFYEGFEIDLSEYAQYFRQRTFCLGLEFNFSPTGPAVQFYIEGLEIEELT